MNTIAVSIFSSNGILKILLLFILAVLLYLTIYLGYKIYRKYIK